MEAGGVILALAVTVPGGSPEQVTKARSRVRKRSWRGPIVCLNETTAAAGDDPSRYIWYELGWRIPLNASLICLLSPFSV